MLFSFSDVLHSTVNQSWDCSVFFVEKSEVCSCSKHRCEFVLLFSSLRSAVFLVFSSFQLKMMAEGGSLSS